MKTTEQFLTLVIPYSEEAAGSPIRKQYRQHLGEYRRDLPIEQIKTICSSVTIGTTKVLFKLVEKTIKSKVKNIVERETQSPNRWLENKISL